MSDNNGGRISSNEIRVLAFIHRDSPFEGLVAVDRLNHGLPGIEKIDGMIAYRKLIARGLLMHSDVVPVVRITNDGLEWIGRHRDELAKHTKALVEVEGRG